MFDKKRVFRIYLQHTNVHRNEGTRILDRFATQQFPRDEHYTVVVDNALTGNVEADLQTRFHFLSGDNSNRDFSGWQRGINWVLERYKPDVQDVFVLANDTFHRSYGQEYLKLFVSTENHLNRGAVVGYVDGYPEAISIFGLNLQYWIRSSLMIITYEALARILPLNLTVSDSEIFSNKIEEFFKPDVDLSKNYQQFLKRWLFGVEDEHGVFKEDWHSQARLSAENFVSMKEKAKSILSEHIVSARLQNHNIPIYNVRSCSDI